MDWAKMFRLSFRVEIRPSRDGLKIVPEVKLTANPLRALKTAGRSRKRPTIVGV